jgi:diphthamide biosynthesis enzyme Dph1/Dph2-like protein
MYNLELDKAKKEIEKSKAKTVLIQLPDGLKPKAKEIYSELKKTGADIYFWGGSCFGACDLPSLNSVKFDLVIQFGHSEWKNVID